MPTKVSDLPPRALEEVLRENYLNEIEAISYRLPQDIHKSVRDALSSIPSNDRIGYWDIDSARTDLERVLGGSDLGGCFNSVATIDQLLDEMSVLSSEVCDFIKYNPLASRTIQEEYVDQAFEFLKQELELNGFISERSLEEFLKPEE